MGEAIIRNPRSVTPGHHAPEGFLACHSRFQLRQSQPGDSRARDPLKIRHLLREPWACWRSLCLQTHRVWP